MRLEVGNTKALRLANGSTTTLRPVIGQGVQGLPGPGSAAWTALEAVTTGAVRQAPDGSWIKSTGNRTTRASFDATEQGFWTAVAAKAGTFEQVALANSFVQRTRVWDAREQGIPLDGTTVADTDLDDLLDLMDPGDTLHIDNAGAMKLASRHDIDQKLIIEGDDSSIVQSSTAGALRFVAGSDGSRVRNLVGVGPDGTTYAANSVFIAALGSVATYLEDIALENVRGQDWGRGTFEAQFVRGIVTRDVHTEDCVYIGQSLLSCEDFAIFNPTCDTLQGLSGNNNCYPLIFSRDSTQTIANAPRTKNGSVHGGWARNTPWEALDAHAGQNIKVFGYHSYNTKMGVCFTLCPNESGVDTYGSRECWAFGCTAESGVSDGTGRDGFMLVGTLAAEKSTGGFVGCSSIGHGDQDLSGDGSGGFFLSGTEGAQIIGGRSVEGSPHGVVVWDANTGLIINGLDIVDPWSTASGAVAAIRLSGFGQSLTVGNTRMRAGTKSATNLRTVGIRAASGDTTSRIHWGGGNEFAFSGAMFAGAAASLVRQGAFGATPVARPAAYTQTYSTATRTHANPTATSVATTAATQTTPWGFASQAQADAIVAAVNALIVDHANSKGVLNSVIDDLQSEGLIQ